MNPLEPSGGDRSGPLTRPFLPLHCGVLRATGGQDPTGCIALIVVALIGLGVFFWLRDITETGREVARFVFSDPAFWDEEVTRWKGELTGSKSSEHTYLVTKESIPLRAIARRPNVPLFEGPEAPQDSFAEVMRSWKPYYIYEYDAVRGALRVDERARLRKEEALWVLLQDVYCWTTRECFSIEQAAPIYASREEAEQSRNPIVPDYTFAFQSHFVPGGQKQSRRRMPLMAALPVLQRKEGGYYKFIRPDPEPEPGVDRPYQVCWVRWDGENSSLTCRLRLSRLEFDEYTKGLQKLLFDYNYGSPDEQARLQKDFVQGEQAGITGEEKSDVGSYTMNGLFERSKGIPHLTGGLVAPIERGNKERYNSIKDQLVKLADMGLMRQYWDADEIAYINMKTMP